MVELGKISPSFPPAPKYKRVKHVQNVAVLSTLAATAGKWATSRNRNGGRNAKNGDVGARRVLVNRVMLAIYGRFRAWKAISRDVGYIR